ncbi:hypothetical protein K6119_00320 [Paracrocinitomix mangrovi]|uniref:hypothetical protein n=1 Tax=Paracrocinitomix mangrovi TaxID=2862509 RepID=UPI001C8EF145|nr:hypothetical protein [Paracrocinitomix mangrovi]UKN01958.1 hypothetical protein K6119_00320 [Paracrocinitomix mangrovi]
MKNLFYLFAAVFIAGCAPSRFVEPLNKGELSVGGNFGGPCIEFGGAPIPIPMTAIEVGYGVDSTFTVYGGWHTTAAFFGNLQFDIGGTWQFLQQKKYVPNLSASMAANFIYSFEEQEGRMWPVLDVNAFWNYGKRNNYWYVGFNNYFETMRYMEHNVDQKYHWLFAPQLGHVVKGKKHPWRFTTEVKFLAPWIDNTYAFVPYKSLFGKWGSTGVYLGFSYPIQLKK